MKKWKMSDTVIVHNIGRLPGQYWLRCEGLSHEPAGGTLNHIVLAVVQRGGGQKRSLGVSGELSVKRCGTLLIGCQQDWLFWWLEKGKDKRCNEPQKKKKKKRKSKEYQTSQVIRHEEKYLDIELHWMEVLPKYRIKDQCFSSGNMSTSEVGN